jgi:hypothetical protein
VDFNETVLSLDTVDGPKNLVTVIDGRVRALRALCQLKPFWFGPWSELERHYDFYAGLVEKIQSTWPRSINKVVQFAGSAWSAREVTDKLVSNTLAGMMCSLLFAFLVLLIVTQNYIVSSMAILTITCIMGNMMVVIYWQGDGLGVS